MAGSPRTVAIMRSTSLARGTVDHSTTRLDGGHSIDDGQYPHDPVRRPTIAGRIVGRQKPADRPGARFVLMEDPLMATFAFIRRGRRRRLVLAPGRGRAARPRPRHRRARSPDRGRRRRPLASTRMSSSMRSADRRDVVVVAQSFGGYVAPIVAERIGARLIVLVAGMVPSPGESAEEMFANTGWQPERLDDSSARVGLLPRRPVGPRGRGAHARATAIRHARQRAVAPPRLARDPDAIRPVPQRPVLPGAMAPASGSRSPWDRPRRDRERSLPGAESTTGARHAP